LKFLIVLVFWYIHPRDQYIFRSSWLFQEIRFCASCRSGHSRSWNLVIFCYLLQLQHATAPRDGFRERGARGHLSFGAPSRCGLFGRLSEKRERMPLLCVPPPQKSIFCCANFGSTFALNVQQKLKPFLHSSQEQTVFRSFLGIYSSFVYFRSSFR